MNFLKSNLFVIFILTLVSLGLNSCGGQNSTDRLNVTNENEYNAIDCNQAKNECLEKAKEILPSFIEKMAIIENESNTEDEKNEKIKAVFQNLILADEINEKEQYLKENCKEIYEDYELELYGLMLLYSKKNNE